MHILVNVQSGSAREPFTAPVTRKPALTGVDNHVVFQTLSTRKRSLTQAAYKRSLSSMGSHVVVQDVGLSEASLADIAHVATVAQMLSHVDGEAGRGKKLLRTLGASERPVTGLIVDMPQRVSLQLNGSPELLRTLVAGERRVVDVRTHVREQQGSRAKPRIADVALEKFPIGVVGFRVRFQLIGMVGFRVGFRLGRVVGFHVGLQLIGVEGFPVGFQFGRVRKPFAACPAGVLLPSRSVDDHVFRQSEPFGKLPLADGAFVRLRVTMCMTLHGCQRPKLLTANVTAEWLSLGVFLNVLLQSASPHTFVLAKVANKRPLFLFRI